jgi:hypothetical protein
LRNLYPWQKDLLKLDIERGNVLYLLDGWDECLLETRREYKKLLNELIKQPHLILTTRPSDLNSIPFTAHRRVVIKPFDQFQIKEYVRSFFSDNTEFANKACETLTNQHNQNVLELIGVPLQCKLLCESWEPYYKNKESNLKPPWKNQLPLAKAFLYQNFIVARLIKFLSTHEMIPKSKLIDTNRAYRRCSSELKRMQLLAFAQVFQQEVPIEQNAELDQDVRDIALVKIIQTPVKKANEYEFLHSTYAEFFAALHLVSKFRSKNKIKVSETLELIEKCKENLNYEVVWCFVSALLKDDNQLWRNFMAIFYKLRNLVKRFYLCTRCLEEGEKVDKLEGEEYFAWIQGYSWAYVNDKFWPGEKGRGSIEKALSLSPHVVKKAGIIKKLCRVVVKNVDAEESVREAAAEALGIFGQNDEIAKQSLRVAAQDKAPGVQLAAEIALRKLGVPIKEGEDLDSQYAILCVNPIIKLINPAEETNIKQAVIDKEKVCEDEKPNSLEKQQVEASEEQFDWFELSKKFLRKKELLKKIKFWNKLRVSMLEPLGLVDQKAIDILCNILEGKEMHVKARKLAAEILGNLRLCVPQILDALKETSKDEDISVAAKNALDKLDMLQAEEGGLNNHTVNMTVTSGSTTTTAAATLSCELALSSSMLLSSNSAPATINNTPSASKDVAIVTNNTASNYSSDSRSSFSSSQNPNFFLPTSNKTEAKKDSPTSKDTEYLYILNQLLKNEGIYKLVNYRVENGFKIVDMWLKTGGDGTKTQLRYEIGKSFKLEYYQAGWKLLTNDNRYQSLLIDQAPAAQPQVAATQPSNGIGNNH